MSPSWSSKLNRILSLTILVSMLAGFTRLSNPAFAAPTAQQDGLRVDLHSETGKVSFIGADPSRPFRLEADVGESLQAGDRSRLYLEHFGEMLGLSDPASELIETGRSGQGADGRMTQRYQQVYRGVPILAGELIVNMDSSGALLSISGEISPDLSLSVKPSLTADEARTIAVEAVSKGYGLGSDLFTASLPTLWIFDERLLVPSDRPVELVWRVDVRAGQGKPINELVLIHAQTGGVSLHFNQIETQLEKALSPNREAEAPALDGTPVLTATPEPATPETTPAEATQPPAETSEPTPSPTSVPVTATATEPPEVTDTETVVSTDIADPTPEFEVSGADLPAAGTTWYVSMGGNDGNDCLTTSTTCASINGALGKPGFVAGDTINVASGTYTGTGTYAVTLDKNVTLSGGWAADFSAQTGFSIIDGEGSRRCLKVNTGVTAFVEAFIIQNGTTGIFNFGTLSLSLSTVSDNGSLTAYGSGIDNSGALTLNNSTIRDNKNNSAGGGVYNNGSLTLNNSTVSSNQSTTAGGAIYSTSYLELNSSTISGNIASNGGGVWRSSGTVDLENTILAGNTAASSPDCGGGTMNSSGYNLIGDTSNCYLSTTTGDQTDIDPNLGELIGDVDAPKYHPLLVGSPAVDAGNPAGCMGSSGLLDADQRGASRVGVCDIGAYEYTAPGAADRVVANVGSGQRTPPFGMFAEPFQAVVLDSVGSPVNGITVTFTAPTSGPSGTFVDTMTETTTVDTSESGVATSASFTANGIGGAYIVTGEVGGIVETADFQLTNFVWYVSNGGDDFNDCLTPGTACASINGAMAKPGFVAGDAVFVGAGTYTDTGSEVVLLSQDAVLRGGWDPSFTTQSGVSTIDGEDARRGVTLNSGRTASMDRFAVQHCSNSGVYIASGATLTVRNSTFRDNRSDDHGGGLFNDNGTLYLINSTVSNNVAVFGGGISTEGGNTEVYSSTITNNTGIPFGGGIRNGGGGTVTLSNSIVAGNLNAGGPDCRGDIVSSGYNLIGDVVSPWCTFTAAAGDLTQMEPKLGPLVGFPGHHPLQVTSPAIDAGNPAGCTDHLGSPLLNDQRGIARSGVCDIGAFEYTLPGPLDSIVVGYGDHQRTPPYTDFYYPFQAALLDSNGSLIEESHLVTFTAPGSGPSGIFADSGTNITTAMSDGAGIATAPIFTANSLEGAYILEAAVGGVVTPAEFQLTHFGWYVSSMGSDGSDCMTSLTPCASIEGVLVKTDFLPADTVLVSTGTYAGTGSEVVFIDNDLRLIGGWDETFTSRIGMATLDGENSRRGVTVDHGITATLEHFIIQNGSSSNGAGVFSSGNVTLYHCIVRDNSADGGGGLFNNQSGSALYERTLTVKDSAIVGNTATNSGGGIENSWGAVILVNSTISGNSADGSGGIKDYGGTTTLKNSTISDNEATNSFHAGGLQSEGGGVITVQNSIVAGNIAQDNPDCKGDLASSGYNLIGNTSGCTFSPTTGDLTNVNPNMSLLQDLGGLTLTHGLYPGSPAIDAGNPTTPGSGGGSCEATDQRGVSRPLDGDGVGGARCDIGAYELDPASPPILPPGERDTYNAENGTTLPGTFVCDETVPSCTLGADPHADAAHRYASDTYAFYADHHGRDSMDDAGMLIISSVHYDSGYDNAFWDGVQVVYGDAYGYPLADDVVAHELTHGVTDYTSNLFYYYQSGAINESFSDLWGEFVDLTNGAGDDSPGVRWLIGEDVTGLSALRDMESPPTYGDPDMMTSTNYYTGSADMGYFGDNGGVHTNSGVNNKAVYLMVDGGSFNDQTVTALGIDKVAAVYYEVQTSLLTSGADYRDLYNALYQGCLNLVGGAEGITASDCDEVREATLAVEMDQDPIPGYNPQAELCPPSQVPSDLFYDDFESGDANWTFAAKSGTSSWGLATGYATSGTQLLWGNDYFVSSDSYAAMNLDIALPVGSQPFLYFQHAFGYEDPDYDGGWLEGSINGGAAWADVGALFDDGLNYTGNINTATGLGDNAHTGRAAFVGDSHGYVANRYDLSSRAGQNVRFRWRMSTDSSFSDLGWALDDVRIYTCRERTKAPVDFDGDDRSEVVVFRGGAWRFFDYDTASFDHGVWTGSSAGCIPAPMDYDGDGGVEPTQLCGGAWHFYNDDGSYNKGIWTGGMAGDLPVPADYDGDGTDDVVVWRAGAWRFFDFATAVFDHGVWTGSPPHWLGGTSIPVPMDYDGDGAAEFTVWSGGPWHFYNDDGSYAKGIWTGGVAGDLPVPADYDGDGTEEVVVWRSGAWRFFDFDTATFDHGVWTGSPPHWLGGTSLPSPLDVDGDGDVDFTVWSGGPWHFYDDAGAYAKGIWTGGVAGDLPISRRLLP